MTQQTGQYTSADVVQGAATPAQASKGQFTQADIAPQKMGGATGSWAPEEPSFLEKNVWGPMAAQGLETQTAGNEGSGIVGAAARTAGYGNRELAGAGRAVEGTVKSIPGFIKGMATHPVDTAGQALSSMADVGNALWKPETYTNPENLGGEVANLAMIERAAEGGIKQAKGAYNLATKVPDVFTQGLSDAFKTHAVARAAQYADGIKQFFSKGEGVMTNSVQDSVRSIQIADQMKSRAAGVRGAIDPGSAQLAATDALQKVGVQASPASAKMLDLLNGLHPQSTFEEIKQARSKLGTYISASKNPADRLVGTAGREALTDLAEQRARDVGQTSQWNSYNDIWRKVQVAKDNWLQSLYGSHSPYEIHRILTGENGTEIKSAAGELGKKFGLDPDEFKKNLDGLKKNIAWAPLDKGGLNFRGVLGTIGKHPLTGLAAYSAAQAMGLPVVGRFLAVMASGKVADILEQAGQPRAALPETFGNAPQAGAGGPPTAPPSVLTPPPHPIPPQFDHVDGGAPPRSAEIANAVESIQAERAVATKNVKGQMQLPDAPTEGLPPKVGAGVGPIERRTAAGEAPGGAERRVRPVGTVPAGMNSVENVIRAKLGKGGLSPQEETTLKAQLTDIEKHPAAEGEGQKLAEQIRAARALSGKQTSGSGRAEGRAQAENIRIAKQATFRHGGRGQPQ